MLPSMPLPAPCYTIRLLFSELKALCWFLIILQHMVFTTIDHMLYHMVSLMSSYTKEKTLLITSLKITLVNVKK